MAMSVIYNLNISTQGASYGNISSCSSTSAEYAILLSCIYIGNTLLGLILSVMVLWAIWPEVRRLLGLPFYAVNLLGAAILECLVLPFGVSYLLNIFTVGSLVCHVLGLIPKIVQRTAAVFLVWMFLVRYMAVKQPLKYKTLSSIWVCGSVSFTLWSIVIAISVTEQVLTDTNTGKCFPDFRLATEWAVLDLMLSFIFNFLPLSLLCFLGHFIYRALKNSPSVPKEQRERIRKILYLAAFSFGALFCPMHIVMVYQSILLLLGYSICEVNLKVFLPYQFTFALNSYGVAIAPIFYVFSSSTVNRKLRGLMKDRQKKVNADKDLNK
ncbi:ovarian cancer G-protein coupled receptor 1-like [Aquarana catesbeiana]|uniref:ovarian cancer G-protein coupled receptor 1-like n=1 Tax=Aquarana catesbeiana TaxID=8400 RepID=UPI003CC9A908